MVVAINSATQSTVNFEDVVASMLLEEMRRKSMESDITDALTVRGCPKYQKNRSTRKRAKSRGRSRYTGECLKKLCWKFGKAELYNNNYR